MSAARSQAAPGPAADEADLETDDDGDVTPAYGTPRVSAHRTDDGAPDEPTDEGSADPAADAASPPPEPNHLADRPAPTAHVRRRFVRAYLVGASLGTVAFVAVLWDGRIRPMRTALATRVFSNFYDVQARALLSGELDVPVGALSIEGFRVDGKEFMYFPPWPAILRTPVLAVTDRFDGRLTAPSMLVAYIVGVVCAGMLAWRARTILAADEPFGVVGQLGVAIWGTVFGAGSIITYLAGLPWVYHEAYLWSTAGAIGGLLAITALWERPSWLRVGAAASFASITILSRATTGWAIAVGLLVVGVVGLIRSPRRAIHVGVIVSAIAALALGIGVNWAKFRHVYLFPLDKQVWTAINPERAAALRANDGHLTNWNFLPTTLLAYLRPDGIRFASTFPWISLPADPAPVIGGAVVDQRYRTGSILAFMPVYVALSAVGLVRLVRSRRPHRGGLRTAAVAAVATPGAVLVYGYVAHRYTVEFLPGLLVLSAAGLTVLARFDRPTHRRRARVVGGLLVLGGLFGIAANTAIALEAARVTHRGPPLERLIARRAALDRWFGGDRDPIVVDGRLPPRAPVDQLVVVGDCEALYLASGDLYEPWVPVALRDVDLSVTVRRHPDEPGELVLLRWYGAVTHRVVLQFDGEGNYRMAVFGNPVDEWSDWTEVAPGATIRLSLRAETARNRVIIDAPGWVFTAIPIADWNQRWISVPNVLAEPNTTEEGDDIVVRSAWGPAPEVCRTLLPTD